MATFDKSRLGVIPARSSANRSTAGRVFSPLAVTARVSKTSPAKPPSALAQFEKPSADRFGKLTEIKFDVVTIRCHCSRAAILSLRSFVEHVHVRAGINLQSNFFLRVRLG